MQPDVNPAGVPEQSDGKARSQTLSRGLSVLEILAAQRRPMTVAELARDVGLHRSIVHRLLRTLEDHRLVRRTGESYVLGRGLLDLASAVEDDVAVLVVPHLQPLADATDLAAFVVVEERDSAQVVAVCEPVSPSSMFTLRIGYRHPLDRGAPGYALAMLREPSGNDDARLVEARSRGWAWSAGEVMDGVRSVAVPVPGLSQPTAIAVIYVGERNVDDLVRAVCEAVAAVSRGSGS